MYAAQNKMKSILKNEEEKAKNPGARCFTFIERKTLIFTYGKVCILFGSMVYLMLNIAEMELLE